MQNVLSEEQTYRSCLSSPLFKADNEDPCEITISHIEEDQVVFDKYSGEEETIHDIISYSPVLFDDYGDNGIEFLI